MRHFFSKLWTSGIIGTFLTGLFFLLPIALTFLVLDWLLEKIINVLGPGTFLGDLIVSGGGTIVGPNHDRLAFLVGMVVVIAIVWLFGMVIKSQAKLQLNKGIDRMFEKMPLVRSIYKPVAQVVRLFSREEGKEYQGMSVVVCRFGGDNGIDLLGLMTSPKTFDIADEKRHLIYLPTSPLPLSGGLILVPKNKMLPMPDISVDELMQIYFSLGVFTPDIMSSEND
jgi:uncharacterized membrane protein